MFSICNLDIYYYIVMMFKSQCVGKSTIHHFRTESKSSLSFRDKSHSVPDYCGASDPSYDVGRAKRSVEPRFTR